METVPEEGSPRHRTKSETLRWKLSKDDESQTKTGVPSVVKYLSAFFSAEVCDQRKTVLLSLLTALQNARAMAHRTEKASSLPALVRGNKAREQGSPAPARRPAPAPHSGGLALILKLPFAQRKQLTFV